jgi:signal transduction histidine kinase
MTQTQIAHDRAWSPELFKRDEEPERAGTLVRQTIRHEREAAVEDICLADSLARICASLQAVWVRDIRFDMRSEANLPVVKCDRLALQNAVLNLLFNAHDAMPDGGVISLHARPVSSDYGEGIEVRVADNGIGMTPDTVVRAFDPFFTTKPDGLGGVGLLMVRSFVQDVGGRISIESEYGTGTTVRLEIPVLPRSARALVEPEQKFVRRRARASSSSI